VARVLTPARRQFLERHFARHAVLTVMVARHASALRLPAFALAALHGVRPATFAAADAASALLSVPLVVGLGWFFADRLALVQRQLQRVELVAAALGLLLLLGWWGLRALLARRAAEARRRAEP
jgi:membrane protein DedA with SNARE-associated domain